MAKDAAFLLIFSQMNRSINDGFCHFTQIEQTMKFVYTFFGVLCFLVFQSGLAQTAFQETGSAAGIGVGYGSGVAGGGVSFCDFNGDGWDDLTFASQAGDSLHFYQNTGGSFIKIPAPVDNMLETKQVIWVDFDNDGDKDLFVTAKTGINRLYERIGDWQLEDITLQAGLGQETEDAYGACWADVNRDGWLDLLVTQRNVQFSTNRNYLYLNNGDQSFTEIGEAANIDDPGKAPFCAVFMDYNNDKWPDIYLAQDKTKINTLLKNQGNGEFFNASVLAGANLAMNAMGIAVGDYNRDGWQDLYISNTPQGNRLLKNDGDESFTEVSIPTGTTFGGTAWGTLFLDADGDGWEDLYVSGWAVGTEVVSSALYINDTAGAFFEPENAMPGDTVSSYGNACGDFNQDGALDLAVVNVGDFPNHLWENMLPIGNWLKLRLTGILSNRDGVGTKLTAYVEGASQLRYKHCGIGYLGQNAEAIHFGLGTATTVDSILIEWPTGHIDRLYDVDTNQLLEIEEGSTTNGMIAVDPELGITGVGEADAGIAIRAYPNPTRDEIVIESPEAGTLDFLDFRGRSLAQWEVEAGRHTLVVPGSPPGAYWLRLKIRDSIHTIPILIH
jgi:hypothetical protein